MRHFATTLLVLEAFFSASASGALDEVPASARKTLNDGKLAYTIRHVWQEIHDNYTTVASSADGRQKWSALESYAQDFRAVQKALKVGENIQDYPGILAHGTTRWDADTKKYELTLGLRPFDAGDGLGQFSVTFDLKGIITEIHVHKYPW